MTYLMRTLCASFFEILIFFHWFVSIVSSSIAKICGTIPFFSHDHFFSSVIIRTIGMKFKFVKRKKFTEIEDINH